MDSQRLSEYQRTIEAFHNSDDAELRKFARAARIVFNSPEDVPHGVPFEEVASDVEAYFPTPFASSFIAWTRLRTEFQQTDPADMEAISTTFLAAFTGILTCWRQLVHFLPFVLLAPLSRLRAELAQKGGRTLARAFAQYESFYRLAEGRNENDRERFEDQQRLLLESLIELCTNFSRERELPKGFFFNAIITPEHSFAELFPRRFGLDLKFIQGARNRLLHGLVYLRHPEILAGLAPLVEVTFLDTLSIITPLCKAYGIYYVEDLEQSDTAVIANTLSFAGRRILREAFRLSIADTGSASIDKFIPKHIYLIDRQKGLTQNSSALPLGAVDYVDLTPFIVERSRVAASTESQERRLYALEEYRSSQDPRPTAESYSEAAFRSTPESRSTHKPLGAEAPESETKSRFIRFMDIAGRDLTRLPHVSNSATPQELRELADLLEEIDEFSSLVEGLGDYILLRRTGAMDFARVRQRAWERISRHQLESIINVESFTYSGEPGKADGNKPLCSYDPSLYEPPAQVKDLLGFFASNKRGLILSGASGYGKTTLLASSFLERLRQGDIAIFLTGRHLAKGSLKEILYDITSSIGYEWTLRDLDNFVSDENAIRRQRQQAATQIVIFIDALNEYTSGGGAQQLLRDVIDFVTTNGDRMFERQLRNVRVVAACRTETWLAYRELPGGRALEPSAFSCEPAGEPITVTGFDDIAKRKALYEKYRNAYNLHGTEYEALALPIVDLFRSPLMLSLIAETYGARSPGEVQRTIPSDLNYFDVFNELRKRKLQVAASLVPAGSRRDGIQTELEECLLTFTTLLYKRMTSKSDPRDYVSKDLLARKPMAQFNKDRRDGQITAFRALREIGIITSKVVSEQDAHLNQREGRAFTFFHDRYAEYELAAVYGQSVLRIMTKESVRNPTEVARVSRQIEWLIDLSKRFPVLSGALDHWFQMSLHAFKGDVLQLIPLCNRLSLSESGIAKGKASEVLTTFAMREFVPAKSLYKAVFTEGFPSLRTDMANALAEAWPAVTSDMVREFVEACDPKNDELTIEALASVFSEHANSQRKGDDGTSVIAFIARVSPDLKGLASLLSPLRNPLRDLSRVRSHLVFLLQFSLNTIVSCSERTQIMLELQTFLVGRFRSIIDFIVGKQSGNAFRDLFPGLARGLLLEIFERTIYGFWENGASCDGANDSFFVAENGIVQRELLEQYMPYMCAVHNRDLATLSLAEGSPFLKLTLKLLNYKEYSIVGFAAYLSLTIAAGSDSVAIRRIVSDLMANGSDAGRFIAVNIIEAYSIVYPPFAPEALAIVANDMLPFLADKGNALPHLLVCAAGIVEIDTQSNWKYLTRSLDAAFAYLADRGSAADRLAFGKELRCITLTADRDSGTKFVDYLFSKGYANEESIWHDATLEICAGLLLGHRADLLGLFARHSLPDPTFGKVVARKTQDVLDQQRTFGTRARWNVFFVKAIADYTKLRYLMLKHMLCPIGRCNSVSDWATQMGIFMIEAIRAYTAEADDEGHYSRLTVEDVKAGMKIQLNPGKGIKYISTRKVKKK